MGKIGPLIIALMTVAHLSGGQTPDSLDIKIGQMILIGIPGPAVDTEVLREVREGKVGSIILFEKNVPRTNSFIALKKIIWTYRHAATTIPLFVCIDQEGGRVNRLKDKYGFPRSITAEQMGSVNSFDSVRFYGEATAGTLAGLGINVNFAPVVDLASNPDNPVIVKHGRAFSNDEEKVTLMAREFIKTHEALGVITVLKHFPGHGSSVADTHLGVADVTNTWEERELTPYARLIHSGDAQAIMSAHIVNRNLDPTGNPGTLSSAMLTGILRNKLGFDGVIFSDDMQMHAITEHFGLEEAVRLAIVGGIDIMTFSNNISDSEERTPERVHRIIKDLVIQGKVTEQRIDQSYQRIVELKKKFAEEPDTGSEKQEAAVDELKRKVETLERENEQLKELQELQNLPKKKKRKGS